MRLKRKKKYYARHKYLRLGFSFTKRINSLKDIVKQTTIDHSFVQPTSLKDIVFF